MSGSAEMSTSADELSGSETDRQAAWAEYFAAHPEVLASWAHQHGYWPPTATLTGNLDADVGAVGCWHTEAGTPCDWNICRQLDRQDEGVDPGAA